jgi:phosphatidylglycerophosphatase A
VSPAPASPAGGSVPSPAPPTPIDTLACLNATVFGSGHAPIVPGTFGTLASLPLAVAAALWLPLWGYLLLTLVVTLTGIWAADRTAARVGRKDPGIVVVDEAAGMLITLAGAPVTWLSVGAGFVLFRIMDILKPFPARRLEALPGGYGIVVDDLFAGAYAAILLRAVLWLAARYG